jgi:hypothetical protein
MRRARQVSVADIASLASAGKGRLRLDGSAITGRGRPEQERAVINSCPPPTKRSAKFRSNTRAITVKGWSMVAKDRQCRPKGGQGQVVQANADQQRVARSRTLTAFLRASFSLFLRCFSSAFSSLLRIGVAMAAHYGARPTAHAALAPQPSREGPARPLPNDWMMTNRQYCACSSSNRKKPERACVLDTDPRAPVVPHQH